ncbi:ATP-binding protein [Thermopolyspora sp. NPDC052614]|uniref:ATP-binding protein n=1 Tax=Thermopolyspora sp. NPDC052614 TaxID=3155682 RepID=UPI00341A0BED
MAKAIGPGRPGHASDDITLIVSELITNSIVHGAPEVRLTLYVRGGMLFGEVIDHGAEFPHLVAADDIAEHGRGLAMVRCMTQCLGWSRTEDGAKSVWFSYRLRQT